MIIRRSINKEEVKDMPKAVFPGQIHVVQTPQEAERAVAYLKKCSILGIDSETRPSFTKGQSHKVALLQISSEEHCFLFRLNLTGLTLPVITLLETPAVTKVGLSLRDDFMMLHKRAPFEQRGCIELQEYVRTFGIQDRSLQKIYAILFGEKISKSQRLSNWEADVLTPSQQQYAATDAWACLNIYNRLQELKRTGDFELIKNNLAAFGHPKAFELAEDGFHWLGDYEITADEVLGGIVPKASKLEMAKQFLREQAERTQRILSTEIIELAAQEGISKRTLETAKKELKIKAERCNNNWYWNLKA